MSQRGQMRKIWSFPGCAKIVLRLHTARTEKPDTPKTHPSAFHFQNYHLDTPRCPSHHPPEISWEYKTPIDNNRRQQTKRDSFRHPKTLTGAVWVCLAMSVGVCCLLLASCANWRYLGGCLGDVWWVSGGIWVVFMEIGGAWMCLGGIWLLSPCSMEP